ncbi:MAG: Uma2 family endonuclease [Thermoanaerobaculia bacterium]
MSVLPLEQEIEYPTSDGQPMAETSLHRMVMSDLIFGLENRYLQEPDVWAGGNLFLCYEEGNPAAIVSPDVLLAKGTNGKWPRPNYLLWEEPLPCLVVEVTSKKTKREDPGKKKSLYERLGIEEVVLFDPYGDYLRPRLQGYRLALGRYQRTPLEPNGALLSQTTGLEFHPEGKRLRLLDPVTGERYLWPEESEAARKTETAARRAAERKAAKEEAARQAAEIRAAQAEARAAEEAAARQATEEQVRVLKAELERLRKG